MINIITIHCQTNFGSALQAYALHKFLILNKYENEVIDYRPEYIIMQDVGLKKFVKSLLLGKYEKNCRKKYDEFITKNIKLTSREYHNFEELKQDTPIADIYISGSDQLWNPNYTCGKDDSYKLLFVDDKKKISYATSIGTVDVDLGYIDKLKNTLEKFSAISVREKSSVDLLSDSVLNNVKCVCDPVYLLPKEHYSKMTKKNEYGEYILVYLVQKGELLDKTVEKVKEKYKCKVISVSGAMAKCKCDLHIKDVGPIDMLTLVSNAKAIVTSSFHATSFSIIFNKDFYPITNIPNNERILNILNICGLNYKNISSLESLNSINEEIDYDKVNTIIEEYSLESKEWLLNNISKLMPITKDEE